MIRKNKSGVEFSWSFLGWLLLIFLTAVIIILFTPSIAEGFEKGVNYFRDLR
ncbi:hypothetical protein HYX03_01470 [Candidatus Woesearchaeota archaeon]|nr:hypothetical protein [Candidatus Woesearchaeota archaeon]